MSLVALIDGDEAIYKACVVKHGETDWDAEEIKDPEPPTYTQARDTLVGLIDSWVAACNADRLIVCLSPDDRRLFRRGLAPYYKADRNEKPDHFWSLASWVRTEYECRTEPGLEADDVLGILSGENTVICSSDKDMKTVPGRFFNPNKGTTGVVDVARANYNWMLQTLTGDSSDGYKGCPGIGSVKARAALDNAGPSLIAQWRTVEALFRTRCAKVGTTDASAIRLAREQAILARILRPGDLKGDRISYALGADRIELNLKELIERDKGP